MPLKRKVEVEVAGAVKVHSHGVMSCVWCPVGRFTCRHFIQQRERERERERERKKERESESLVQADLLFL